MPILKHPGPPEGREGRSLPPNKKNLQVSSKKDHISKTENRTKKVIFAKNERQVNSNLASRFGQFWRKLNFGCPKRPFWTPAAPKRNIMWYEVLRPFLLAHCASFMLRWPLLRGGRVGLNILSLETIESTNKVSVWSLSRHVYRGSWTLDTLIYRQWVTVVSGK